MARALAPLLVLLASVSGCSKPPEGSPAPRVAEAAPPPPVAASSPAPASEPDAAAPGAEPALDAGTGADAAVDAPPPKVKVFSIGMHVAGGPYDEETKKPFLADVEPRYPELARCWAHVSEPKQADVGVDVLIPAAGGKARISNPRSTIPGDAFKACVVAFFESIEWKKPATGGPRGLSYSVRFKP